MKSVNRVTLLGNVGRDPEIKTTGGGTLVSSFSMGTNDRYKDSSGDWKDKAEWHNLVAYGRTAEIIRDYVFKGSKLYVEGKLTTRSWDDKDSGKKVYRTEIVVNDITLLDGKREDSYEKPAASTATAKSNHNSYPADLTDDEIPF